MTVSSITQASHIYATNEVNKTSSTSQNTSTQISQVDKMDEMKEKYKDVYTPIPETYSKADENLQTQKIYEANPNFIEFKDFLKIVNRFYDGEPLQLGVEPTQEQRDKQKMAFEKASELFGGEDAFNEMQRDAMKIKENYPVNNWAKDSRTKNATELAQFTNAAIYEGLEDGKTLKEAKINAGNLRSSFLDTSYADRDFMETLVKAGRADPNALNKEAIQIKIDLNDSHRTTMDLRKYGIEANWESYNKYESQTAMIAEIEKKIGQFQFMMNNEKLIKEEYEKLDASYQTHTNNAGYKKWIEEEHMPMMEEGLNIFKNYKIYDSINIKS